MNNTKKSLIEIENKFSYMNVTETENKYILTINLKKIGLFLDKSNKLFVLESVFNKIGHLKGFKKMEIDKNDLNIILWKY